MSRSPLQFDLFYPTVIIQMSDEASDYRSLRGSGELASCYFHPLKVEFVASPKLLCLFVICVPILSDILYCILCDTLYSTKICVK